MPARQPHHDAAWLAAENGILQPAVGPAAERRAAAKAAALSRAPLPGRPARRDSSKSSSGAAIAADASICHVAGERKIVSHLPPLGGSGEDRSTTAPSAGIVSGTLIGRFRDSHGDQYPSGRSSHLSFSGPQPGPFDRSSDYRSGGGGPSRHSFSGPQPSAVRRTISAGGAAATEALLRRDSSAGGTPSKTDMRGALAQMERAVGLSAVPGGQSRDLRRLANGGGSGRSAHAKVMMWDDAYLSNSGGGNGGEVPPAGPAGGGLPAGPAGTGSNTAIRVTEVTQLPPVFQRISRGQASDPNWHSSQVHRVLAEGLGAEFRRQSTSASQPAGMGMNSMEVLPGSDMTRALENAFAPHLAGSAAPSRSTDDTGLMRTHSRTRAAPLTAGNLMTLEPRRDRRQDPQERLLRWLEGLQDAQMADADRSPGPVSYPGNVLQTNGHTTPAKQQQQEAESPEKAAGGNRPGSSGRRDREAISVHEDSGCSGGGGGFVSSLFGCFGHRRHFSGSSRGRRGAT